MPDCFLTKVRCSGSSNTTINDKISPFLCPNYRG
jgi:hypothetical protein